jgi:hypothetical protein
MEKLSVLHYGKCASCLRILFPEGGECKDIIQLPHCRHTFHVACAPSTLASHATAVRCTACDWLNDECIVYSPSVSQEEVELCREMVVTGRWEGLLETDCSICRMPAVGCCLDCYYLNNEDANTECRLQFNLLCRHFYHEHCISRWRRGRDTCPACVSAWRPLLTVGVLDDQPVQTDAAVNEYLYSECT